MKVREHPIVAQYLATIEAPSQAIPDAEMDRVAGLVKESLPDMEAFASSALPEGFTIQIVPLAVGETCAWCSTPMLEQVAIAARQNTEIMAAMERVEKHRMDLQGIVNALQRLLDARKVT